MSEPAGEDFELLDLAGHLLAGRSRLPPYLGGQEEVRLDLVMLPGGRGYVVDADGGVWPVGNAPPVSLSLTWTRYGLGRGLVASN